MKVKLYTMCKYPQSQKIGCFIKDEEGKPVSPCFDDLVPLFAWLNIHYPNRQEDGYSGYIL